MPTKHAVYDIASFKAVDADTGTFKAVVSVFGNVDLIGDRVVKGAFRKTLDDWQKAGDPIPVIWSHDWGNPHAHIGTASAAETAKGLEVDAKLDMDNPFAAQVYRLLAERRVKEFSFGYEILKEKAGEDGANELHEVRLLEVGPTLKGMNPSTELLAVKSALETAAADSDSATDDDEQDDDMVAAPVPAKSAIEAIDDAIAGLAGLRDHVNDLIGTATAADDEKTEQTDDDGSGKSIDAETLELLARLNRVRAT